MSIHTIEIYRQIVKLDDVVNLMRSFNYDDIQIDLIQNPSTHQQKYDEFYDLTQDNPLLGIEWIDVNRYHIKEYNHYVYYVYLKINPQMLITHQRSIELYSPSEDMNRKLMEGFRDAVSEYINIFVSDKSLIYLNLTDLTTWKCKRIDYCHNITFNSVDEKELFLNLTKRTSRYKRRRKKRSITSIPRYDQSTAESNKSGKLIIYNKKKQIQESYTEIPEEDVINLSSVASNIIRFEYQCYKPKVRTIKASKKLKDLCVMNFLDEKLAHEILLKSYLDSVGAGDFYYPYSAKKELDKSCIPKAKKERIYNLMRLIAQARGVFEGREQFINGGHYIKKTDIEVHGTASTFLSYIKDLESINVNPVMIPKDWHKKFLQNPIGQLKI